MRKNTQIFKILIQLTVILILFGSIGSEIFSQPLANGHDKFLGNVLSFSGAPANFDTYWNQVTPENNGKWLYAEGTRDANDWGRLDEIYNYAKQRGYPFKFHTLVWGQQQPTWITTIPQNEQKEEVEEWIRLVGQRYPDMDMVDVVNEALPDHAPAAYRNALGGSGKTGWDWVVWAFEKAREYMPNSKLILNDYNILDSDGNTNTLLQIINVLKEKNLVDAIGVQGHRFELENASVTRVKNNLDRLAATNLPIYITEFDLGNIGNTGTANDQAQLDLYKKFFPVLWEHPAVKGITIWGYIQGQIWQTSTYLIRADGTERPAMQWLRTYLSTGNYQSVKSGNWNDVSTWQWNNGTEWVSPVPALPSISSKAISILDGHTVTVSKSDSVSQVNVLEGGKLVVNPDVNLLVKNGPGTDLNVSGSVENSGAITQSDSTVIRFVGNGTYSHKQDGGSIPTAVWGAGSTCRLEGITSKAPSNGNQDFYNIVWNNPGQAGNLNLGWNENTIGGNIIIENTGSGRWQMCAPSVNGTAVVTILGNVIQSGGQFTTNGTGNAGTTITINHSGSIDVTGGNFAISRGSQGGTGTTTWNLTNGNISISNATTQNSNSSGAKFVFDRNGGTQLLTLSNVTYSGSGLPVEVKSGVTLSVGTSSLEGSGIFILNDNAVLATAHADGIDGAVKVTGTKTLSNSAGYSFNGTSAQVTGSTLPEAVKTLTINNNSRVTLSGSITINNTLEMKSGVLSLGGNQLTYANDAELKYSGSVAQATASSEFPKVGGPNNLSITNTNASGVTLHESRTIKGNLEVAGKFVLGSNTFTAATATSTGSTRFVVTGANGTLKLSSVGSDETLFPVGTTFYAPVWISNSGKADTIGVRVEADTAPAPEGGRVNVKWNITESVEGEGNYLLKFGWVNILENSTFRNDRAYNAKIFYLADKKEAGTDQYTTQFETQPYSVARGGIIQLGSLGVGRFGTVSAIDEDDRDLSADYVLSQNYPNPFNPTTTIEFSIAEPAHVKLVVYDMLGSEVAVLLEGYNSTGNYRAQWNAVNNASGIYFYKLITPQSIMVKKMMLLK